MTRFEIQGLNKATRSASNWKQPPGGLDTVNAKLLFASNNVYGIPVIAPNASEFTVTHETATKVPEAAQQPLHELPEYLIPYRVKIPTYSQPSATAVHFFVEDYRFETIWTHPTKSLGAVRQFGTVLSPDFSLYRDWPLAIQIWNTYRTRWVAAWWQAHGLRVVPSVAWSTPASYEFCFLGIPQRSIIAISSVGLGRDHEAWRLFHSGFEELLSRLKPAAILCYGELPVEQCQLAINAGCFVRLYPPHWSKRSARRQPSDGSLENVQSREAANGR
jgi:hypothetical protein